VADARLAVALLALSLSACGPGPSGATPAPSAAPSPAERPPPRGAGPELSSTGWGLVSSARYSIELSVPERDLWHIDDSSSPWFLARHVATRSELALRTWRAARTVKRAECEQQARLWRPNIPQTPEESVVERRMVAAPEGWSTELVVGVAPAPTAGELQGFALAFGVAVGRCYALLYTTTDRGRGAEITIARRLGVVADEVVPSVRVRSIDERVH
jgi:hypothetical protein